VRPALPLLTPENRPFWTGGERGQLLILRCTSCGAWLHPPVPVCRHCLSLAVEPVAVSGRGRLLTWTVNHQQWLPDLPVPYVLVVVELEEDPVLRVVSRLVDADPDRVQIGMTVEVAFEQHDDVWLPMFRLTGVG
jgi:uncharacterized OB-fold protein